MHLFYVYKHAVGSISLEYLDSFGCSKDKKGKACDIFHSKNGNSSVTQNQLISSSVNRKKQSDRNLMYWEEI